MKKDSILLIVFLVVASENFGFSQKNFQSGFVIRLNGDTVPGYIDYRNWNKNPVSIRFQEKSQRPVVVLTSDSIKEFSVSNEKYCRGVVEVEIEDDASVIYNIDNQFHVQLRTDTVFLQSLINGEKELYYYKGKNGAVFYYIKEDNIYKLLVYKQYMYDDEEGMGKSIRKNNGYVGELIDYFKNCSNLVPEINRTEYRLNDMMALFNDYYKCMNSTPAYQKPKDKIRAEFGVIAGPNMANMFFQTGTSIYSYTTLMKADFSDPLSASGGLFVDFVIPRTRRKWSIDNDLMFLSYNARSHQENYESENTYTKTDISFKYSYLKLYNSLRYRYPIKDFSLFLNIGFSNGMMVSGTNHKRIEDVVTGVSNVSEGEALDKIRKHEEGFILGSGIRFKKCSFESRFEKTNGLSEYSGLRSGMNRLYFLLGYRF